MPVTPPARITANIDDTNGVIEVSVFTRRRTRERPRVSRYFRAQAVVVLNGIDPDLIGWGGTPQEAVADLETQALAQGGGGGGGGFYHP
jgi:hypothetical protein